MTEQTAEKKATFVRRLSGFNGEARQYRLDPPIERRTWDEETILSVHEYVAVSGVYAMFTGPETYIFPCDEQGNVVDWGELEGSFRGDIDHEAALTGAGYTVVEEQP